MKNTEFRALPETLKPERENTAILKRESANFHSYAARPLTHSCCKKSRRTGKEPLPPPDAGVCGCAALFSCRFVCIRIFSILYENSGFEEISAFLL
ncbi:MULTISPECIES: hypothetical protein [Allobaculum]|uniref:hypothetical protein n=1 Tax=Allobaculum TaxID=174708 RepID=UPI001E2BE9E4|nr:MULTISPECIES: hypothetical protein [Allobaculum]UNT92539.1 hypothetical protein KWG61_10305 [Allobaculum sp. Allo2]